jgi:hypothetical protein
MVNVYNFWMFLISILISLEEHNIDREKANPMYWLNAIACAKTRYF